MQEIVWVIVRDNLYNQAFTYNLPFFSLTRLQRKKLRLMETAYEKATEPGANREEFEYATKTMEETLYVSTSRARTIVMIASKCVTIKSLSRTAAALRERMGEDEGAFFITGYLSELGLFG